MTALNRLFDPRGVVVIGASHSEEKLGAVMARSLRLFDAPVAGVNSRSAGEGIVATVAEAAAEIADSGGTADLAVLCVPAPATAAALDECAAAGIGAALVCAGGFAESGEGGFAVQQQTVETVERTRVRMLGPNTSGFFRPERQLFASFVPGVATLPSGGVAIVASSGGVNHMLAFSLADAGVGISLAVGIGAALDVTHADVLDYLIDDASTTAVALHVETVRDGRQLIDTVRRLSAVKPVVALIVGRNDVDEFAASHTGALATSWKTTRAVLRQAGAVLVDDEAGLVAAVSALSRRRSAPNPRARVGLITGQAGPGLLIADGLADAGVELPRLQPATIKRLGELLPPITFQANPVDTGRPGPGFSEIIAAVAGDPSIDIVAVYGLSEPVLDLPGAVAASGVDSTLPVTLGMDGPRAQIEATRSRAAEAGLPVITGASSLARATAALVDDARRRYESSGAPIGTAYVLPSSDGWHEVKAKDLLERLGIDTPPRRVVSDAAAAAAALRELGGPIALKIVDETIIHKTEIGGVHLGIRDEAELAVAFQALRSIGAVSFLVEKMADRGVDLVVGARKDPVFGPVVVVGFGGTTAEAIGDVAIRSIPLTDREAASMVDELQSKQLLFAWRGGPTLEIEQLSEVVSALAALMAGNPWIADVEINPLRLTTEGLVALDAVLLVDKEEQDARTHH